MDLFALFAEKVPMRSDVSIEMVLIITGQPQNDAVICKHRQISVNRAETDIRIFTAKICINHIRTRMILA